MSRTPQPRRGLEGLSETGNDLAGAFEDSGVRTDWAAKRKKLAKELERLTKQSAALSEARSRLAPGSSRARVTSANAKWARVAEARDGAARRLSLFDLAHTANRNGGFA